MRLVEVNGNSDEGNSKMSRDNGYESEVRGELNGHTGNGQQRHDSDLEEDDEEIEEEEPVSATLVLRVVNEPTVAPSPGVIRKHSAPPTSGSSQQGSGSVRRHQSVEFLDSDKRDTFLQVQIQRSTSSSSISGGGDWRRASQSRSRPSSVTPGSSCNGLARSASATPSVYITEPENGAWSIPNRSNQISRDTTRESSPCSSLYDLDCHSDRINPVELLRRIEQSSRAMETGLRGLRDGVDTPNRLLDVGQDTLVLSGLNRQAGDSLKHIKNLYEETKYLKAYLEKLEAKAHYDMVVRLAEPYRPPWYRRILFLCLLGSASIYIWHRIDPQGCTEGLEKAAVFGGNSLDKVKNFFTTGEELRPTVVIE